jgi:sporulation protein YlmC with PRC-barrel domain
MLGNQGKVLMLDWFQLERMGEKMKQITSVMLVIALFFWAPVLSAFDTADRIGGWAKTYKLSTLNQAEVKNLKGERLGQIEDFVMDPQGGRIALVIISHAGMAGIGQKVKIIPYEFLSFDATGKNFILDVSKEDLISPMVVKNIHGDKLGEIGDLVIDSQGRIPFVLLSHAGRTIVIPYSALSMERNYFVLDASEEKLASAPAAGEKEESIDQSKAAEIYRYFGQAPYWTEDF